MSESEKKEIKDRKQEKTERKETDLKFISRYRYQTCSWYSWH